MDATPLRAAVGSLVFSMLMAGSLAAAQHTPGARLVIHEWGTFTVLQDDTGRGLSGINIDDEPLPEFVHNLRPHVLAKPNGLEYLYMKGAPPRHPYVTVRLETPVMYFYPPAGQRKPLELDVHVGFRGGWLTEFYPLAAAQAPGLEQGTFKFGSIGRNTFSSLDWHGLQVGTPAAGPPTDQHVWTAPRRVQSANLTAESGESERYLFYRGVGNFDAPLRVVSDAAGESFDLRAQFQDVLGKSQTRRVGPLWLVHVKRNGTAAFRTLEPVAFDADPSRVLTSARRDFSEADFSAARLQTLLDEMHSALVASGLYDDEAAAMLATWKHSYFKSAGLRLFFVVPRSWTDQRLPLDCSLPADVQRVMVARVELISPEQRSLLAKLRKLPLSNLDWLQQARQSPNYERLVAGRSEFGDLGVAIPPDFKTYLDLGRFRNALVIDEHQKHPSANLSTFITAYGLRSYLWFGPDRED